MAFEDDAAYFARRARKQQALADTATDFHAYCFHIRLVHEYGLLAANSLNGDAPPPAEPGEVPSMPPGQPFQAPERHP